MPGRAAKESDGGFQSHGPVLALSGGIGGAKLALGLYHLLAPGQLSVLINTGDDFVHLGLHVSPDLDTVMYTLAGVNNPHTGWGRANETWTFMEAIETLGAQTWFRLGDGDLATHVERTRRLRAGDALSAITRDFCARLDIDAELLPMSDDPVRTCVETTRGMLPFQHYFVREQCAPRVTALHFEGAPDARANSKVIADLSRNAYQAVIICPSNPFISIDPILAVPGLRDALARTAAPVIAVSPIVGGLALKGPTAKMMSELGLPVHACTVAAHYGDLLDAYVLDTCDAAEASSCPVPARTTNTVMSSVEDKVRLARDVLIFATTL